MNNDQIPDKSKSREQLLQDLAMLRARLAAEEQLREREEHYRNFFRDNHAAMLLIDPLTADVVNANSAACTYYGYTIDEITNLKVTDINMLTPDRVRAELEMARSAQGRHLAFKHRLSDGRIRDVEVVSGPIFIGGREVLFSIVHDITERKEAEAALREAERKYRKLLRYAPAAIYEIDFRKKRFTSVNEAMSQMLGYSIKELLALNPFDLITEDDKTRFYNSSREGLRAGESERNVEYKIRTKDGRIIDTVLNATFSKDELGKPVSAMVVAHDITKRKQEERQVSRYNAILKGINRIFGHVIRANSEESLGETCLSVALELTGSQFGFICEKGPDGLLHDIAISDTAWEQCRMYDQTGHHRAPGNFEMHGLYGQVLIDGKSLRTNTPLSHPTSIGLPQGHPAISCFLGVPITHRGQTIGVLAVANRTSGYGHEQQEDLEAIAPAVVGALLRKRAEQALVESEERLRLATEAADMYGWEVDLITRAFKWSENAESVLEISMPVTLTEVWALIHPEDLVKVKRITGQAVKNIGEFKVEYRINRTPGEEIWVFSAGLVITDKGGIPTRLVGVTQNITRRKEIEQTLRQLNETLEQQVAERTDLAETRARQLQSLAVDLIEAEERERQRIAGLLHDDLQQLLAAGRMQLQTVCERLPADTILTNVQHLLEESISKSRRLSHELSPPVLHHSNLIAALEWLSEKMKHQFGLEVQLDADTKRFEHSQLKVFLFRAVQELLFNVVKHAGVKSACIGLSTTNGSELRVTVSDNGQGFDPDILASSHVLAGLGLVSLRERTRSIGGDLIIKSAPGKGSRFTLAVPYSLNVSVMKPQPFKSDKDRLSGPFPVGHKRFDSTKGIRVLFTDDHKVMRQGLISMISGNPDITVIGEAANGREAIERVRQLRPDVVVMDISMPVMDGVEATRRIKAEFPEIRVIGLSMFEDDQITRTMYEAGAEVFLSKSVSAAELLKSIYGIYHGRKLKTDPC